MERSSQALLVLDAEADAPLLRFREAAGLRASGSAQFSLQGLSELRERVGIDRLHVVDLRQESHCFAGGAALSWYGIDNHDCAGLDAARAAAIEAERIHLLRASPAAPVGSKEDVVAGRRPAGVRRLGAVSDEASLFPPERYLRVRVTDHCAPNDEELQAFLRFHSRLPSGAHVHFHCRGGKGRTALFLALVDILASSRRDSLATILERQASLGAYDLRRLPEEGSRKRGWALERRRFLSGFYERA